MTQITYQGPAQGVFILGNELEEAGFELKYERPVECRTLGEGVVVAAISIIGGAVFDAVADDKIRDVVKTMKERFHGFNVTDESGKDLDA